MPTKTLFGDKVETETLGMTMFGDPIETEEVIPTLPDPAAEDKRIKEILDTVDKSKVSLSTARKGLNSLREVEKKKDAIGIGLGPMWDMPSDTRTMRERLGYPPPEKLYKINFGATLYEIPKGIVRFLERGIGGTFGGTVYDWLGQFIAEGGYAVDWISKVGEKDKDRIYNPLAESIIATGQNISQYGKESREWWAYQASTGWEAMDADLRKRDPIAYGAGRLSEGVASSALSVLAMYLSGGATAAPTITNAGIQINRGLLMLSTISAAGGFEHAQNQDENFYWATLHGLADGTVEYAMETTFLEGVGKGTGKLIAGAKEGAEEFFTGMLQNTRAGILENEHKGMSVYDASKKAMKDSLVQSPWDVASGFIGGFGIAGGSDLVQLIERSEKAPVEAEKPAVKEVKAPPTEAIAAPRKPVAPITKPEAGEVAIITPKGKAKIVELKKGEQLPVTKEPIMAFKIGEQIIFSKEATIHAEIPLTKEQDFQVVTLAKDPAGFIVEGKFFNREEFVALQKVKPEAVEVAPAKVEAITKEEKNKLQAMGYSVPEILKMDRAEARKLLKAKPRKPKTEGFLGVPFEFPEPEVARGKAEQIYQDYINRFASIENAVKKAKKLGLDVLPGEDPALRARSYLGMGRKVEVMLEKNTYRVTKQGNIEVTGEGLKPILDSYENLTKTLEPSRNKREKDFNDYLIATRTVEDLQRKAYEGAKKNIASKKQVAEAQENLDKLAKDYGEKGIAIFEEHAQRLYEYQKRVLHLLVDAGNISQKQFDQITELNKHYIPFDRVIDEQTIGGVPVSKKRFTKARAPIVKIKGSELEVEETMESVIKNTYRIVDAAERNAVAANLAKLADTLPDKISPVRIKTVPIKVAKGEIGVEEAGDILIFRASQFAPKGKVIEYFVNGKRKYVELSGNLYDAMTGLNETSASVMIKVLAKPAHWLRVGATITPEFMLRNPIRDQWTALMQTSFGFVPFVDSTGAIADIIGKNDIYHEWLASGGAYSGFVELNRPALEKAVKDLRGRKSLLGRLNIISQAQNLSQLMEMATRLGAFKAARRKGITTIEAGFESREASIDFARRGAKMADFNRLMAFFNAGVQGMDKTIRTAINRPYQTAVKGVIAITIPSLLLYLRNRKEEDYAELAQWKKDLYWNFKIGGIWWRVPKPFLFGQLFGSIPERFFEYLDTKDTKAFDDISRTIIDSVTPVSGDPEAGLLFTALKPIIEVSTNWNFFLQRPIVPVGKQELLPPEQFTRYTSETAKQLGRWLNYSPAKIENLVRGYFGGTGRYALQGTDALINGIRRSAGMKIVPKRPKQLADIPLIKGFVHRPPTGSVSRSVNDFYESTDVIIKGWNTVRLMQKEKRRTEVQGLLATNPEIRLHSAMTKFRKRMSELTKQSDVIVKQDISTELKKKRLRKIDDRKLELAKRANDMIRKAQEKAQ